MKVVEIFKSIDGEGKRAGEPAVFIRLHGCNLNCSYCDTKYSHNDSNDFTDMTVKEILDAVGEYECKNITLTGGEPLIHENVYRLISKLSEEGYNINIETNGSVNISPFIKFANVFVTLDYKCKSSGCEDLMYLPNYRALRKCDVLKFVVSNKQELKDAVKICGLVSPKSAIYFSPVWGVMDLQELADFVINCKLPNVHLQIQLHKIIWDANKRGV